MENDLVSVVITTYHRHFELIRKSIESVLNQTYPALELIVVDDNGNTGADFWGIEKGLQQYSQENCPIYYIKNEENSGAQISRNKGILKATGKYIAFLDDDDDWMEQKIEKQVKVFVQKDIGLVYCKGYQVIVNDHFEVMRKTPYNMSACFLTEVDLKDMLYGDYIGTTSQVMIRRDVFAKAGLFDIDQPARQDYEMWIRVSQYYRCVGVDDYLFHHIQHTEEQISKNPVKAFIGIRRVYFKYRKLAGATSRCHFFVAMFKLCIQRHQILNCIFYGTGIALYYVLAILFDRSEMNNRKRLHEKRIRSNKTS